MSLVDIDAELAQMKRERIEREGLSIVPGVPNRTGNGIDIAVAPISTRLRRHSL